MTKKPDPLDWVWGKCPVCKTAFHEGKPQCQHMRKHKIKTHVQAQKYNINPQWRRRRGGKTGQMK